MRGEPVHIGYCRSLPEFGLALTIGYRPLSTGFERSATGRWVCSGPESKLLAQIFDTAMGEIDG